MSHPASWRAAVAALVAFVAVVGVVPAARAAAPAPAAPAAPKPPAKPDPKAEAMARKLVARAELAVKDSRFDEAIDLYREAHGLAPRAPELLALGRLLRARGERYFSPTATPEHLAKAKESYVEAKKVLNEWMTLAPDAPVRAEIGIMIDDMDGKLKRTGVLLAPKATGGSAEIRMGRISVVATIDGASVLLDGVRVGKTPLMIEAVEIGEHTVAVAKLGTSPFTAVVHVEPDATVELKAELTEIRAADPLPGAGLDGPIVPVGGTPRVDHSRGLTGGGLLSKWWFWTAVGVAVLGGASIAIYAGAGGQPALPPDTTLTYPVRSIFDR